MTCSKCYKPKIENPYPDDFTTVSEFEYLSRLVLLREPDALLNGKRAKVSYIVGEDYTVAFQVDGKRRTLTVPRGMLTDLASVPWGFRNTVGRVGPHLEAAIVHDYLFIAWQLLGRDYEPQRIEFKYANAVMFAALDEADTGLIRKSAIKFALSLPVIAWNVYKDRNDHCEDGIGEREGCGLFVDLGKPSDRSEMGES